MVEMSTGRLRLSKGATMKGNDRSDTEVGQHRRLALNLIIICICMALVLSKAQRSIHFLSFPHPFFTIIFIQYPSSFIILPSSTCHPPIFLHLYIKPFIYHTPFTTYHSAPISTCPLFTFYASISHNVAIYHFTITHPSLNPVPTIQSPSELSQDTTHQSSNHPFICHIYLPCISHSCII